MECTPAADFRQRVAEIESTITNPRYLSIYRAATAAIDPAKVAEVQRKYATSFANFPPASYEKYADLAYWIAEKIHRVVVLNLDRCEPRTILDIGVGAGHFGAICAALGHRVIGIDIEMPLYDDLAHVLGSERRTIGVYRRRPLPSLGCRFDMVTAFAISFDSIGEDAAGVRKYWSVPDWHFLFNDLLTHHLNAPAAIYCELNTQVRADKSLKYDADLLKWVHEMGAAVIFERGTFAFHFPSPVLRDIESGEAGA